MKKILITIVVTLLLLVATLVAIPFFFKDKIIQLVKNQANNNINAVVNFDNDIELSLIKSFPNFTLGIHNLSIVGVNEFEGDTLMSMKTFSATLDVMSVIKGEKIQIIKILLDEPNIHAIVLKNGKANWDIVKATADTTGKAEDTAQTKFNIALKKLEINQANISYDDKVGNMQAVLTNFNHTLTGDFSQDNFLLNISMDCDQLSYTTGGLTYLNKVKATVNADIDANMKEMKFTFKENEIALNELLFGFDGNVAMKADDINMNITYQATKTDFKNFLSLVPGVYTKDFASVKTSGKLGFNGFAKGTYNATSLPAFAFNLLVENAMFQYPSLPAPVNNIQIALAVTNPNGNLNNTKVDLSKFHFEIMNDPFDAKMIATNVMRDPAIDAAFKGKLNLDNITKIVPLDEGMKVSGLFAIDLTVKGSMSTIEAKQYENFDAKGTIELSKFMFASKDLPKPMFINSTSLSFNPKNVKLQSFDAKIGNSDMQMNGELSNFFAYTLGKGVLKGNLNFTSNTIDANEFLSPETATQSEQPDTASLNAPEIPDNIDFTLNANIKKLKYINMDITNFGGQVIITGAKLAFNNIALYVIDAGVRMNGFYETTNPKKPTMTMAFGITKMEFKKAFATFNTIKKIAPIAENMVGDFSTDFNMNTVLDQHLNPVYNDLFAEGTLNVPQAGFNNVKLFNKAAEVLKYDKLKDPTLRNVRIQFKVEKGRVFTKPFDMMIASQKLTLSGSTGLDQTIDYIGTVAIPRAALGTANNALDGIMAQANAKAGTNVKLSELINVNLGLGGTFTSPTVKSNLAEIAKNEANSVKDQLLNEADKKRKELEAKAKAEADKLKKEAEAKAQAEINAAKAKVQAQADKAKAEAERIKKEAEAKAKAEEDRLKKQAEDEAKKKLKGLFGK
jgi:hypothetical protein